MTLPAGVLHAHLCALRSSLSENIWSSPVGAPIIAVFNELLAEAKRLAPDHEVVGVIERHNATVSARKLLMLVDHVLLALEQRPSAGVDG